PFTTAEALLPSRYSLWCYNSDNTAVYSGVGVPSVCYESDGYGPISSSQNVIANFLPTGACLPYNCNSGGWGCGSPSDGCCGTLNCGTCGTGQFCSTAYQCNACDTCSSLNLMCGTYPGNCGTISCGGACVSENESNNTTSTANVITT